MNVLECMRLLSAACVALLGILTVGLLLASSPLIPYEVEELTLVALDDGLVGRIEDALVSSESLRENIEKDEKSKSPFDILANEAKDHGIDIENWSDDNEGDRVFLEPVSNGQRKEIIPTKGVLT